MAPICTIEVVHEFKSGKVNRSAFKERSVASTTLQNPFITPYDIISYTFKKVE